MFELKSEELFDKELVKLINKNTKEYIAFIPECGGLINEIVFQKSGKKHLGIVYFLPDPVNQSKL